MVTIVGGDWGNFGTKIVTEEGAFQFRSCLGEYREFNIDKGTLNSDDIIFEYRGQRGFAGTLAENEALFLREMAGDSKNHEDALLRILIAIHRFTNDSEYNLVVGQPIRKHKAEKEKIIEMLEGDHTITVNGVMKTFTIQNVAVAPEGAGAYWTYQGDESKIHIIDVGSSTVNCATVKDGMFIDRDSFTLPYGANSEYQYDLNELAKAIIAVTSKRWNKAECVRLCGGISENIFPFLSSYFSDIQMIRPLIKEGSSMKLKHPVFANAVGFYELGRDIYG